jgi:hypothetical protein
MMAAEAVIMGVAAVAATAAIAVGVPMIVVAGTAEGAIAEGATAGEVMIAAATPAMTAAVAGAVQVTTVLAVMGGPMIRAGGARTMAPGPGGRQRPRRARERVTRPGPGPGVLTTSWRVGEIAGWMPRSASGTIRAVARLVTIASRLGTIVGKTADRIVTRSSTAEHFAPLSMSLRNRMCVNRHRSLTPRE